AGVGIGVIVHATLVPDEAVVGAGAVAAEVGREALHADPVLSAPEIKHLAGLRTAKKTGVGGELQATRGPNGKLIGCSGSETAARRIGPDERAIVQGFSVVTGCEAELAA